MRESKTNKVFFFRDAPPSRDVGLLLHPHSLHTYMHSSVNGVAFSDGRANFLVIITLILYSRIQITTVLNQACQKIGRPTALSHNDKQGASFFQQTKKQQQDHGLDKQRTRSYPHISVSDPSVGRNHSMSLGIECRV